MPVRTEKNGSVTTVILSRPEVRNAVDRPTAEALAAAFRAFDADVDAGVAVLFGEGGTFCAGADLKAIAEDGGKRANRVAAEGDGPLGVTRMLLSKPVIAAVEGHAVASWRSGAICASRTRPRCSASSAVASACRWSTAERYDCRGSSGTRAPST